MDDFSPIAEAASWLGSLGSFWNGEKDDEIQSEVPDETSCTSYSSESSDGFVLDESYIITAGRASNGDKEDDISDLFDSVAEDSQSLYSYHSDGSGILAQGKIRRSNSLPVIRLNIISEDIHETEDFEALLRAKMSSLWYRMQEDAQREHITETPTTKEDKSLLEAFGRKKALVGRLEERRKTIENR